MTLNVFELECQCSKTKKLATRKNKIEQRFLSQKTRKSTFHILQLFGRKVDCGITAKSELSEIWTKLAADQAVENSTALHPQKTLPEKTNNCAR